MRVEGAAAWQPQPEAVAAAVLATPHVSVSVASEEAGTEQCEH